MLKFNCLANEGVRPLELAVDNLVVAGWTGRPEALRHHVEEMIPLGIPAPTVTPLYFRISNHNVLQGHRIEVVGDHTSGEAEPVVVVTEDGLWLGLGSDETDRKFEATDIALSKQMCPKVLGDTLWPLESVLGHWDDLILSSIILEGGREVTYQRSRLVDMTPPDELIAKAPDYLKPLPAGTVIMCGTVPAIGGVRPTGRFIMELFDPILDRSIKHSYEVVRLPHVA